MNEFYPVLTYLFAVAAGLFEQRYYFYRKHVPAALRFSGRQTKIILNTSRTIFYAGFMFLEPLSSETAFDWIIVRGLDVIFVALGFSFFHNAAYYWRNPSYPGVNPFKYHSEKDASFIELPAKERTLLFVGSVLMHVLYVVQFA